MNDTKVQDSAYSGERIKITGQNSLRSTTETAESPGREKTAPAATPTQPANKTPLPEPPSVAGPSPITVDTSTSFPGTTQLGGAGALADFVEFLKRTKKVWLIAAGAIFGVMALVTVSMRMVERAKIARAARQEQAVTSVTPDTLLSRCGQPAEDVTKDMYPIILRTMTYQPRENEKIVFGFSRTAEEKSDWVLLSMKDGNGTKKFDTPETKIAALPCLDTKK